VERRRAWKPITASPRRRSATVVSLQFDIAGDWNVIDVFLLDGEPVGWDYH